jgi:tetratricopeptide (TPR) repeat protein
MQMRTSIGVGRYSMEDYAGAHSDFDRAIELAPQTHYSYGGRAKCRVELGDWKGAIADATEAIRLDPDHPSAHYTRGRAWMELGDDGQANSDFTRDIALNHDLPHAYARRARCRLRMNDVRGALDDAAMAIQLQSDYAAGHHSHGLALMAAGRTNEALGAYQKAAELYQSQGQTKEYAELQGTLSSMAKST